MHSSVITAAKSMSRNDLRIPKPPKPPEKPLMPYMRYSRRVWEMVKNENPQLKLWEVGRIIGQMWRQLPDEEKNIYIEEYEAEKQRYNETLRQYHSSPAYQAWVVSKERTEKVIEEEEERRSAARAREKLEPPIDLRESYILEDNEEDPDEQFTVKHVAAARFQRNHRLMHEILNDTKLPDPGQLITETRLQTLQMQVRQLKSHKKNLCSEIENCELRHQAKMRRIQDESATFYADYRKLMIQMPRVSESQFTEMILQAKHDMDREDEIRRKRQAAENENMKFRAQQQESELLESERRHRAQEMQQQTQNAVVDQQLSHPQGVPSAPKSYHGSQTYPQTSQYTSVISSAEIEQSNNSAIDEEHSKNPGPTHEAGPDLDVKPIQQREHHETQNSVVSPPSSVSVVSSEQPAHNYTVPPPQVSGALPIPQPTQAPPPPPPEYQHYQPSTPQPPTARYPTNCFPHDTRPPYSPYVGQPALPTYSSSQQQMYPWQHGHYPVQQGNYMGGGGLSGLQQPSSRYPPPPPYQQQRPQPPPSYPEQQVPGPVPPQYQQQHAGSGGYWQGATPDSMTQSQGIPGQYLGAPSDPGTHIAISQQSTAQISTSSAYYQGYGAAAAPAYGASSHVPQGGSAAYYNGLPPPQHHMVQGGSYATHQSSYIQHPQQVHWAPQQYPTGSGVAYQPLPQQPNRLPMSSGPHNQQRSVTTSVPQPTQIGSVVSSPALPSPTQTPPIAAPTQQSAGNK